MAAALPQPDPGREPAPTATTASTASTAATEQPAQGESAPADRGGAPARATASCGRTLDGAGHGARVDLGGFRERSLKKGVNPVVYWILRAMLVPFFLIYLRMERIGREHLPKSGPLLLASNHRSFLDPFVIGTMIRRPVYYMAKRELFEKRWQAWILNALGAFPVDRGASDGDAMATARAILERGDCVVVFPEGTRVRRGPLGNPKRGIGRLALETGAPIAPIAVIGTDEVRRGWKIRPRKVRLRAGRPLEFPLVEDFSKGMAGGVTERVWACISLQWHWLGGISAPRAALGEETLPREVSRAA